MTARHLRAFAFAAVLSGAGAGPVAADTLTLEPSADTTLFEESGELSNGRGQHVFVGVIAGGPRRRGLLRFAGLAAIPPGSTVTAVSLEMTVSRAVGGPIQAGLYPVNGSWGEGTSDSGEPGGGGAQATTGDATWTRRVYPATSWTSAGGDAATVASAVTPVNGVGPYTWSSGGMVGDVQGWINAPTGNFGWLLRSDELGSQNAKRLGSREQPTAAARPRLTVTYDPAPAGPLPVSSIPATGAAARALLVLLVLALGLLTLRARGA